MDKIDIDSLVGAEFDFHGAANNVMGLGGRYFEVVEDEEDGYRSSMDYVQEVGDPSGLFDRPIARVRLEKESEILNDTIWRLVDTSTGHQWLRFGTSDYNDYYPFFVFVYTPQPS